MGNDILDWLGFGAGIIDTGINLGFGLQNLSNEERQFEYAKDLQQQIFKREDSAYQRKVADLEAAGLNKALAYGGGSSSGGIVTTKAPQMNYKADVAEKFFKSMQFKLARQKTNADLRIAEQQANLLASNARLAAKKANWYDKQANVKYDIDAATRDVKTATVQATIDDIKSQSRVTAQKQTNMELQHLIMTEQLNQEKVKSALIAIEKIMAEAAQAQGLSKVEADILYKKELTKMIKYKNTGAEMDANYFKKLHLGPIGADYLFKSGQGEALDPGHNPIDLLIMLINGDL